MIYEVLAVLIEVGDACTNPAQADELCLGYGTD